MLYREHEIWFRGNERPFPRKVAQRSDKQLKQYIVENDYEFNKYIMDNNNTECYSCIFNIYQIENKKYDTVFLDVDAHDGDLKSAFERKNKVVELIRNKGYEVSRIYFSGRGFHLYIDFDEVKLENYKQIRNYIVEKLGLIDLIDRSTQDDTRLSRLPHSINLAAGTRCVRISNEWSLGDVLDKSKTGSFYSGGVVFDNKFGTDLKLAEISLHDNGLSDQKVSYGSFEEQYQTLERVNVFENNREYNDFPPCVKKFIYEMTNDGELDHLQRLCLTSFISRIWSPDEAHKFIKTYANDYSQNITTNQINSITRRHVKFQKCSTLIKNGMCPVKDRFTCPFYIASNGWVEKLLPKYSE